MAGVQTAVALREQGWTGAIVLLGAETHQPYDRPPLSKAVLLGKAEGSTLDVDFAGLGIALRLGVQVTGLRTDERRVETATGPLPYDVLVIATGAEPIPLPGSEGVPGVHLLRTLDDAERLRPVLARQHEIVVVGAGWIGAEFATAAREAGCAVTVVEAADRPLAGALPAEVAAPMARLVRGRRRPAGDRRPGGRRGRARVVLGDGTRLRGGRGGGRASGPGRPRAGWRARASSWPRTAPSPPTTGCAPPRRTSTRSATAPPSRPPATARGCWCTTGTTRCRGRAPAAANIAGEPTSGLRPGAVLLVRAVRALRAVRRAPRGGRRMLWRGDPAGAAWSVCWLRDGALVALLAVGRPRDLAQGRKLIERGARWTGPRPPTRGAAEVGRLLSRPAGSGAGRGATGLRRPARRAAGYRLSVRDGRLVP